MSVTGASLKDSVVTLCRRPGETVEAATIQVGSLTSKKNDRITEY